MPPFPTCGPRQAAVAVTKPFNIQQNANTDKQAQVNADTVKVLRKEIDYFQNLSDELHKTVITTEDLEKVTNEMNEEISNLDDFFRPLKGYFYWEKHCFDVPICWAFRSLWDTLDKIDHLAADIKDVRTSLQAIDGIVPQIITQLKLTADDTEQITALLVNTYGQSALQSTQTDQTFFDQVNVGLDSTSPRAMTSSTSPMKVSTTKTSRLVRSS